jgi:hypothetical protein
MRLDIAMVSSQIRLVSTAENIQCPAGGGVSKIAMPSFLVVITV